MNLCFINRFSVKCFLFVLLPSNHWTSFNECTHFNTRHWKQLVLMGVRPWSGSENWLWLNRWFLLQTTLCSKSKGSKKEVDHCRAIRENQWKVPKAVCLDVCLRKQKLRLSVCLLMLLLLQITAADLLMGSKWRRSRVKTQLQQVQIQIQIFYNSRGEKVKKKCIWKTWIN